MKGDNEYYLFIGEVLTFRKSGLKSKLVDEFCLLFCIFFPNQNWSELLRKQGTFFQNFFFQHCFKFHLKNIKNLVDESKRSLLKPNDFMFYLNEKNLHEKYFTNHNIKLHKWNKLKSRLKQTTIIGKVVICINSNRILTSIMILLNR